jgi:hypothetical protein
MFCYVAILCSTLHYPTGLVVFVHLGVLGMDVKVTDVICSIFSHDAVCQEVWVFVSVGVCSY